MKMRISRLVTTLAAVALTISLGGMHDAGAQDKVLRVASPGGAFTDIQRKYGAYMFTRETGIKVEFIDGNAVDQLAKLAASRGQNVPFDVVYLDKDVRDTAVKLKLVQKVDPKLIPNLKHLQKAALDSDGYGPWMQFLSMGIAFNKEKLVSAGIPEPSSWADLWDARLAGRVAIPELSHPTGRALLIQAARLKGGDETTPELGIQEIAKIKAHSYYTSTAQVEAQFPTGDVWVAPMPSGRAWGLQTKLAALSFIDPKEGGVMAGSTIDVVAGTQNLEAAHKYINAVLAPLQQTGQATEFFWSPTNQDVALLLQGYPDLTSKLTDISKVYVPNWDNLAKNYDKAVALWNRQVRK